MDYNVMQSDTNKRTVESAINHYKNAEAAKEEGTAYEDNISSLKKLYSILSDNNNLKKMDYFQVLDLIDEYPELASSIKLTETGYLLEGDALERLIARKTELHKKNLEARREAAKLQLIDDYNAGYAVAIEQYIKANKITSLDEYLQLTGLDKVSPQLKKYLEEIFSIEMSMNFIEDGIKFPEVDSSLSSYVEKLKSFSKFYSGQLSDLADNLTDSQNKIDDILHRKENAEAYGDTDGILKYNRELSHAKNEQIAIYQDLLTQTQKIQNEIKNHFKEFSNISLTDVGIAKYKQEIQNAIIDLQNASSGTSNSAAKHANDVEIQRLENVLSLFNEYVSDMQAAYDQEKNFLSQIQSLNAETYKLNLQINDEISENRITALKEIYKRTSDEIYLRNELLSLSVQENISLEQKKKILEEIRDLDTNAYSRKISDIEFEISKLPEDDFENIIELNVQKLDAARQAVQRLFNDGFEDDSDSVREIYSDIIQYEQNITKIKRNEVDARLSMEEAYIDKNNYWRTWNEDSEVASYERILASLKNYLEKGYLSRVEYDELYDKYARKLYEAQIGLIDEKIEKINEEIKAYESLADAQKEHLDLLKEELSLLEAELDIYNRAISAITSTIDSAVDDRTAEIEKLKNAALSEKKVLEELKEYQSDLEDQLNDYNKAISAVVSSIDKEVASRKEQIAVLNTAANVQKEQLELVKEELELLEKRRENYDTSVSAVVSVIDDEIKKLNEEKDALAEANKEQEKKIELAELEERLRLARENRSVRVYRDGVGFVYEANQTAIEEAEKAIRDFNLQEQTDIINAQIEAWEKYKEQWTSIAGLFEKEQNRIIAAQILGSEWEQSILEQRMDILKNFSDNYQDLNAQIELDVKAKIELLESEISFIEKQAEIEIKALNAEIEAFEAYKEKWTSISNTIEEEQNRILAEEKMGAEWEKEIFELREETLQNFTDKYLELNKEIEYDVKQRILSLENEIAAIEKHAQIQIEAIEFEIAAYQEYKKQYTDLTNHVKNEIDKMYAAQLLGENWESEILDRRQSTFENFSTEYIALNERIELDVKKRIETLEDEIAVIEKEAAVQIKALKEQIEAYEKYKEDYRLFVDEFTIDQERLIKEQTHGRETEIENFDLREKRLEEFVDAYGELNKEIEAETNQRVATLESETKAVDTNTKEQADDLSTLHTEWGKSLDIKDFVIDYESSLRSLLDSETSSYSARIKALSSFVASFEALLARLRAAQAAINAVQASSGSALGATVGGVAGASSGSSVSATSASVTAVTGIGKYASGSKNVSGGLSVIDEKGKELVIKNPSSGRYTYLEAGDGVLPANLTENIFNVAQNPIKWIKNAFENIKVAKTIGSTMQPVHVTIGDIRLEGVQNVDRLSYEIKNTFGNKMTQALYKK